MITRLYLMPTHQCNCNCEYCYIPKQEKLKCGDDLLFKEITNKFIEEIKNNYSGNDQPQLRFIGGEPYLKIELIHELSNMFLDNFPDAMVVINTNGTLINISNLLAFTGSKRKNIYHIVSLDGIEEIHNARRKKINGSNTFDQICSGIKLLQHFGFSVYLNMVLDEFSIRKSDEFMALIKKKFRMNTLSVSLLNIPGHSISVEKNYLLLVRVYELAEKHCIKLGGHHRLLAGAKIPGLKCKAGTKTIVFTSDAKFYACQRFTGRIKHHREYNNQFSFVSVRSQQSVAEHCYSSKSIELGEKLYNLYKEKYPEYLQVRQLDKILFGVI